MKDNSTKKGVVNLKNEMFVDITKPLKKSSKPETKKTTIRVNENYQEVLDEIDIKVKTLKFKKMTVGNTWFTGIKLLNKLLEYVDDTNITKDTDVYEYLLELIKEQH